MIGDFSGEVRVRVVFIVCWFRVRVHAEFLLVIYPRHSVHRIRPYPQEIRVAADAKPIRVNLRSTTNLHIYFKSSI